MGKQYTPEERHEAVKLAGEIVTRAASERLGINIAFREALAATGVIQSMSGTGRCYDNARMENFFATLNKEKPYRMDTTKLTRDHVKSIIFRYIHYYNRRRIYSANDGLPPLRKREQYYKTELAA